MFKGCRKHYLFATTLLASGCALDDTSRANHLSLNGDSSQGEEVLTRLANQGYHDAKLSLARLHASAGEFEQASYWYLAAADAYPSAKVEYLRMQLNHADSSEIQALYDALWQRQHAQGNTLNELVTLYRRYYDLFDSQELIPEIEALLATGDISLSLRHVVRLPNVVPLYNDFEQYCQQIPPFHDDSINCKKLQLIRAVKDNDASLMKSFREQMLSGYVSGELAAEDISSIANIAKDRRYGQPNLPLYISLAEIIGTDIPEVWYDMAKRKIQTGNHDDSSMADLIPQAEALVAAGYKNAHLILGRIYYQGISTAQSYTKAMEHWLKVSDIPEAQRLIGDTYLSGALGDSYQVQGINWLLSAARNGEDNAYLKLAQVFQNGEGIKPDVSSAGVFASLHFALTQSEKSQQILVELTPLLPPDFTDRVAREERARIQSLQGVNKDVTP